MEKPSHSKLSAIQGKQEAPATGWGRGFRQPAQRPTPSDRDAGDMAERANALDVSMFQNKKPRHVGQQGRLGLHEWQVQRATRP
jgi:hypothetical protein